MNNWCDRCEKISRQKPGFENYIQLFCLYRNVVYRILFWQFSGANCGRCNSWHVWIQSHNCGIFRTNVYDACSGLFRVGIHYQNDKTNWIRTIVILGRKYSAWFMYSHYWILPPWELLDKKEWQIVFVWSKCIGYIKGTTGVIVLERANVMNRYAILHKSYDNCSFINTPLYWIHHCIFCTYRNVFNGLFLIHTICISLRIFWIHISKIHSLHERLVYFKNRFHLIMLTRTYLRIIASCNTSTRL